MQKFIVLIVVLSLGFILNSCTKKGGEHDGFVVASVNGEKITLAELDKTLGSTTYQIKKQLYDARFRALDEVISNKLLEKEAKKKGKTVAELKKDIVKSIQGVKEEDVNRFFDMTKQRNPDVSKDDIRNYLKERQKMIEERKFVESLKTTAKIKKFITNIEPEMPRLDISADDDPFTGPANAKVTIVEFTDFECPFCARGHVTMKRILEEYKGKVKYVLRDFPLSFHKNAMGAHMAANCANDQKKYWEYTELLWKDRTKLGIPDLKKYAKSLGLDTKKFNDCLDSQKYKAEVEKDLEDGKTYGVRGTPAAFINGLMISGARPFEDFKEVIDKEL